MQVIILMTTVTVTSAPGQRPETSTTERGSPGADSTGKTGKVRRQGKVRGRIKIGKGSSSDDHDAAAFPGTTYRFLGGKELPGSTTERAKQSYPKSHKVAILKEMCPIITVTRPVGMVECSIIHIGLC